MRQALLLVISCVYSHKSYLHEVYSVPPAYTVLVLVRFDNSMRSHLKKEN